MKYISLTIFAVLFSILTYNGCTYHSEEALYPNSFCDTTHVTYSHTIAPILQNNCLSCHSQVVATSGVVLEGYDNARTFALNGSLYGTIVDTLNYPLMPPNGKMSACDIAFIKKWIDEGAPNN